MMSDMAIVTSWSGTCGMCGRGDESVRVFGGKA
jgi:hypothetical protein